MLEAGCESMTKIVRVGVTFPPELLSDFDEVIGKMGYGNRSKAIQDAVTMFISEKKCIQKEKRIQVGVLTMLYEHEAKGLETTLSRVQHHYASIICSTMHIHLNHRECLEAIAVKGNGGEIRKLSDELGARKGVKLIRTTLVPV
jgi:CopG family nickel-responsive transcriptional regulator